MRVETVYTFFYYCDVLSTRLSQLDIVHHHRVTYTVRERDGRLFHLHVATPPISYWRRHALFDWIVPTAPSWPGRNGRRLLYATAAEISLFDANNESINVQYKEEIYPIDRKIYKPCPLFVPSDMKQKGDPAVDFDVSFCRPFFSYREREIRFEWKKAQRI